MNDKKTRKPIYFRVKDMAQIYMVTPATIRRWAREEKIPGQKIGKSWLFEKPTFIRLQEEAK